MEMRREEAFREAVTESAVLVFEDAAFALVEEPKACEAMLSDIQEVFVAATVLEEPFKGLMTVAIPEALARSLRSTMLCIEGDSRFTEVTREGAFDTVCEILNMICGNVLKTICVQSEDFNYSPPCEMSYSEYYSLRAFVKDNGIICVSLSVDEWEVEIILALD